MNAAPGRAATGIEAEARAEAHLVRQGLKPLARNWRARGGELDLVMREQEVLVFVEVRARASTAFGGAAGSVTATKQRRVVLAARQFLAAHPQHAEREARFDVVSIEAGGQLHWLKAAFEEQDA